MNFDPEQLAADLEQKFPDILFAYLFGSAREGIVRNGGDVDIAVWLRDPGARMDYIAPLIAAVETLVTDAPCDLVFLNQAGALLSFEVLQGRILFIRDEARNLHAEFYSLTCRKYEDQIFWMKKQLQYRNHEVQWDY